MKQPLLYRLITQFLVLAVIAGSSALVASAFIGQPTEKSVTPASAEKLISKNAFVAGETTPNLTRGFAQSLAKSLIDTNPTGPRLENGELVISSPDINALIEQYIAERRGEKRSFSPQRAKEKIKVTDKSSAESVIEYLSAIKSVSEAIAGSRHVENLLARGGTEDALLAASVFFGDTKDRLYRIPTPAPLAGYHAAMIDLIETQYTFTKTLLDDPMQAMALERAFNRTLETQLRAFDRETIALRTTLPQLSAAGEERSLLEKLAEGTIFAREARAVGGVPTDDFMVQGTTWKDLLQKIYEWLINVAKEWLKNRIFQEITNMMVAWATGGDYEFGQSFKTNQNFIKDWKSFITGVFNAAAGDFINELVPELCQGPGAFGDLIRLDLETTYSPSGPPVVCTLTQVVSNLEAFYKDFRAGGWLGYSQSALPSSNYTGTLWVSSQLVENVARRAEEVKKAESEAGQGYKAKTKLRCEDGSAVDNEGLCANNEKAVAETTVPPSTLQSTIASAIEAPIHRIANADTWEALVAYLLDTLTAKLIANGDDGFSNDNYLTGTPADPAAFCSRYDEGTEEYKRCIESATNPPPNFDEIPPDDLNLDPDDLEQCDPPEWIDTVDGEPGPRIDVSQSGSFTPEPGTEFLQIKLPTDGADKNYVKAQVDVDVTIGPKSATKPDGHHAIFWLQRGEDVEHFIWNQNDVGYLVLAWGRDTGNIMRFGHSLNWNVGDTCAAMNAKNDNFNAETTFLEGQTYHFRMIYDVLDGPEGSIKITATDSAGNVVSAINYDRTANVIQSSRPKAKNGRNPAGFFVHLGQVETPAGEGPEASTYGWRYENMRVQFTPGNGRAGVPPPDEPLPAVNPPAGAVFATSSLSVTRSGEFLAATQGNSVLEIPIPAAANVNYRRIRGQFTVNIPSFPGPVFQGMFEVGRPHERTDIQNRGYFGTLINVKDSASKGIRTVIDTKDNLSVAAARAWQTGQTYDVIFLYDTSANNVNVSVRNKTTGVEMNPVVSPISNRDIRNAGQGMFIRFGQEGIADEGAYYPPYGWRFSDLSLTLE